MYTVSLTSEQHRLLMDILDCAVDELHGEIVRTENLCLKDALKDRKHILQSMLDTLRSLEPSTTS